MIYHDLPIKMMICHSCLKLPEGILLVYLSELSVCFLSIHCSSWESLQETKFAWSCFTILLLTSFVLQETKFFQLANPGFMGPISSLMKSTVLLSPKLFGCMNPVVLTDFVVTCENMYKLYKIYINSQLLWLPYFPVLLGNQLILLLTRDGLHLGAEPKKSCGKSWGRWMTFEDHLDKFEWLTHLNSSCLIHHSW